MWSLFAKRLPISGKDLVVSFFDKYIATCLGLANGLEDLLVVPELHTTFEGDWGDIKADVFYFHGLANRKPHERLFIFPR